LSDIGRIAGLSATVSQADGWIMPPLVVGGLPAELTAIVYVSNAIGADVEVNAVAVVVTVITSQAIISVDSSEATIETNEINAEVT
jgi:hypothetical protein